jgi:aminoglycoside/choline kinase family phosphotransferase
MTALAIPTTFEALTPEWVTGALRASGVIGDAAVTEAQAEPVGQGVGLLCQLARITLTYDRPMAGAPTSVVAKFPTADPQTRGMVSLFRFYEREVRFYEQIADGLELATPRRYYSAYDPAGGDFILLLEDLTARRLGDQLAGCSLEDARLAIGELAKLHAAWWQSPRLEGLAWMPAADDVVNKTGLTVFPQAWSLFLQRFGEKLPPPMVPIGERLSVRAPEILDRFAGRPATVCHGDYRLDNLFFGNGGDAPPLTVIDWQIAIRSAGTYDVGYMTSQSLDPDLRRKHEMDVLRMYHQALIERGVQGYSFDQCLEDYRWTLLFCFAYPVIGGTMGDLSNERGVALATAMMERSATAIMDWDAGRLLD